MRVPVDVAAGAAHGHAHIAPEWDCRITNNKQHSLELQVTSPPGIVCECVCVSVCMCLSEYLCVCMCVKRIHTIIKSQI